MSILDDVMVNAKAAIDDFGKKATDIADSSVLAISANNITIWVTMDAVSELTKITSLNLERNKGSLAKKPDAHHAIGSNKSSI